MSQRTRTACCGHTPDHRLGQGDPCACACHEPGTIHPAYGPTPAQRPLWPRTPRVVNGKPVQYPCPLVVRNRYRGVARHAPTSRSRIGWFTTGWGR